MLMHTLLVLVVVCIPAAIAYVLYIQDKHLPAHLKEGYVPPVPVEESAPASAVQLASEQKQVVAKAKIYEPEAIAA